MEDICVLDPDNSVHKCALQIAYLPSINRRLALFQAAWNQHNICTERNRTPEQLWVTGTLQLFRSSASDDAFCEPDRLVYERVLDYSQHDLVSAATSSP